MLKVLGKEKCEYYFDKWLEYFFTEADAKFFASLGLNCIRLPFNYRHLEDDMNPRVLKTEGFKHLDRVIDLVWQQTRCTKNGMAKALYSVPNTISIQSSTCIQHPVARTRTGTRTTLPIMLPFGTTKTIKTEQSGYGRE